MKTIRYHLTFVVIILLSSIAYTQDAWEIIARAITAEGGEAKSRINSMVVKGRISIPVQGVEGEFLGYFKRPNKDLMKIIISGKEMVQATNGLICWMIDQIGGSGQPTEMPEDICATYKRNADFDPPYFNLEATGIGAKFIGKEEYNGVELNHIVLTFKEGHNKDFFFRVDNGLLQMIKEKHLIQTGGEMETTVITSDYRDVEGAKYAFHNKHTTVNMDLFLQWEEVKINVELDDALFEMPVK